MSDPSPRLACLDGDALRLRYAPRQPLILDGASIRIPAGKISALVGPNGSGKSTLLKALARQLVPESGRVILDGRDVATLAPRQLAQNLGILFQEHTAPGDLTVEGLAYHGRYAHRRPFESLTPDDHLAVDGALRAAGLNDVRSHAVSRLSGGQRQLAWMAMILAQAPAYLLLDEPTTFLDLAHQFDVMDVVQRLNREQGKTIVLVLHDLNLASRYADCVFALRKGAVVASGSPADVMTPDVLRAVFDVEVRVVRDDGQQFLFCVPVRRVETRT